MAIAMMVLNVYAKNLEVTIVPAGSTSDTTQDVMVNLQYRNTGQKKINIVKWYLPGKELYHPLFKITCNNVPVEYLGPMIKRVKASAKDVIPLAPGKIISTVVALSSAYDMSKTCDYSIQYNMQSDLIIFSDDQTLETIPDEPIDNLESEIQSNNIQLPIKGRPNKQHNQNQIMAIHKRAATLNYVSCTENNTIDLINAVSWALKYANESFNYLNNIISGTTRYRTWFGTYSSTNRNTVKTHYQNMVDVFNSKNITFDCTCTDPDLYAYVYPSTPYKIYLCGVFWRTTMTGTDSKAGTLVHETSHFKVVAGTQDYAYGQTACKNLATTNPGKAIMNADSHEYFAENTPYNP
ncbi:unnamed protein product [Rotaria sp. Silwood1]|nr:unnamed protein product [Rotaria sp. Silwood1]